MLRRLTLLAPATTSAQRHSRFPSPGDAIDPLGDHDARAVRAELRDARVVVGGPEDRVGQTARALGFDLDPHPELAAWSHGAWAGRPMSEVVARDPAAFEAWRVDPSASAPDGESLDALLERSARWLAGSTAEHRSVVIADGSFIRAVVLHVLSAPPESFWRMDVRPLSTTVLSSDGTRWQLRSLGATTHRASPDSATE